MLLKTLVYEAEFLRHLFFHLKNSFSEYQEGSLSSAVGQWKCQTILGVGGTQVGDTGILSGTINQGSVAAEL